MPEHDFSEIAKLSERYSKDPKSRIFVQLADAYRKSNMVDEALEVLKQGLQYHPQYPLAHLIQGRCLFDKRMYAQAKESFNKVIKFDPQNIVALRMIAQVCETLKDEAGQVEAYKGLLAIDPTDATAREKLNALEALLKKQSFFTVTMAQEYERQGNLTEALKIYENLGFTDPSDLGIQEKIRELKQKLTSTGKVEAPAAPKHEEKIEGLEQFESYTKHHEVDITAPPKADAGEKAVISDLPETKSSPPLAGIVEKTLETPPADKRKPEEKPSDAGINKSDFVSSVTDFMMQEAPTPPPKIESMEAKPAAPLASEPEQITAPPIEEIPAEPVADVTALSDLLVAEEKPAKVEAPTPEAVKPAAEPAVPPVKEEPETLSLSDFLSEEAPASAAAAEPAPPAQDSPLYKPAEPEPAVEPAAPAKEEVMSISDLIEAGPAAEPAAPAAEAAPPETKPVEAAATDDTTKPTETEPPATATETKPESAEEPKKQKEEDFKSFQDWLSGLLK